jgi:hypothetical protein
MRVSADARRLLHAAGTLVLVIASVTGSLLVVEFLLRRNVIPNEYYVRTRVLGDPKQHGLFLFIIGDSFMAPHVGGSIEDFLYTALAPHGVRIRNTATAGTGPVQYLEALRREGPRYHPDVVLLSYYVGNDLLDVGCRGDLDDRLDPPYPIRGWRGLYIVQYAAEVLRNLFPGRVILRTAATNPRGSGVAPALMASLAGFPPLATRRTPREAQGFDYERMRAAGIPEQYIERARKGQLNPWIVSLGAIYPDYFRDELLMRSDCAQRAWKETRRVLDLILDEAAALGADVLPVIFPHTLQVDTAHYALYRAWKINVDDEMRRTERPQQLLDEYFRSRGLEPLDLLPAFRAEHEMLFWKEDEHLNMRGQEFSARLIADTLVARYAGARPRVKQPPRSPPTSLPPHLTPVSLPFHLVFADSASRPFLEQGFRRPESSDGGRPYVWSAGDRSILLLPLRARGDVRMDFEVYPFLFPHSPQQRVTIALNGTTLAEVHLRSVVSRYSVILPRAALHAATNVLEFHYAYARAPHDALPHSPDARVLAVAWFSASFIPWPR